MQLARMKIDGITFMVVMCVSNHGRMVNEGMQYFHLMSQHYLITHWVEHYACMVDFLGCTISLMKMVKFISNMPL